MSNKNEKIVEAIKSVCTESTEILIAHNYQVDICDVRKLIETNKELVMVKSFLVAPHAGAWIETYNPTFPPKQSFVAPHAGAWIETASWPYGI